MASEPGIPPLRAARVLLHDLDRADATRLAQELGGLELDVTCSTGPDLPEVPSSMDAVVLKWREAPDSVHNADLVSWLERLKTPVRVVVVEDRRMWSRDWLDALPVNAVWTQFTTTESARDGICIFLEKECVNAIRGTFLREHGDRVFAVVASAFRKLFRFDSLTFVLFHQDPPRMDIRYSSDRSQVPPGGSFPLEGSLAQEAIDQGRPLVNPDTRAGRYSNDEFLASRGVKSVLVYPLLYQNVHVAGLIFTSSLSEAFTPRLVTILDEICASLGAVMAYEILVSRLVERERELSDALRVRNDLLRVLSHDLRNPLNTIIMTCQLLDLDTTRQTPDQIRKYLDIIRRSATLQLDLLQDIMQLGLIDTGSREVSEVNADMAAIAREVVELHESLAAQKQVALLVEASPDPLPVRIDETKLIQVLNNLVNNAIKFTPSGGRVTLSAWQESGRDLHVTVTDTGRGIDPETLAAIERGEKPESHKGTHGETGTGLGLTIVRRLVSLMGGEMAVTSALDQGTTISLAFQGRYVGRSAP